MRYLFFDLEYATSNPVKRICEFGYVLTDEKFHILEDNNFIINPNINRDEWDWFVLDEILTKSVDEYERGRTFDKYYDKIADLINGVDYIFGHTINGDVEALNCELKRYKFPPLNFSFYDIKEIYKKYSAEKKNVSVENILKRLDIKGDKNSHDAGVDAYNTMLEFKKMINNLNVSVDELIKLCPESEDYTEDFIISSIEISRLEREEINKKSLTDTNDNSMSRSGYKSKIFGCFIRTVSPNVDEEKTLEGLTFCISYYYEKNHFKQMLNIIQILCNKGATYTTNPMFCNIFVTYDLPDEILKKYDRHRLERVKRAISYGKDIKFISFNEFLEKINLSEEELDNLPMIPIELLEKNYLSEKDYKEKRFKKNSNDIEKDLYHVSLGDLFKDKFEDIANELEDQESKQ